MNKLLGVPPKYSQCSVAMLGIGCQGSCLKDPILPWMDPPLHVYLTA